MKNNSVFILKNPCNIYTILWCLYYLQGILYTSGGIVSRFLLAILLIWSLVHMVNCLQQFKLPVYFKGLTILIVLFSIYGFIRVFLDSRVTGVASFNFIKNAAMSLLPIYSYFYFTKKGHLNEDLLRLYVLVFLGVAIAQFFFEKQVRLAEALDGRTDFTNNSSYIIVGLLPLTVFWNKRMVIQYSIIAIVLVFVVMGFKRGAMLVALASMLLIIWDSMKTSKSGRKVLMMFISTVVLFYVFQYAEQLVSSSDYFTYRYEKTLAGDASGREEMYPMYFDYFINKNTIWGFLFGNGVDSTVFIFGNGAHNDWLEIAICMGCVGLIVYFYYWICFVRTVSSARAIDTIYIVLFLVAVADFLKAFFSFSIYNRPISATCALGFCLAMLTIAQAKSNSKKIR